MVILLSFLGVEAGLHRMRHPLRRRLRFAAGLHHF
jgi:hypothetical protein